MSDRGSCGGQGVCIIMSKDVEGGARATCMCVISSCAGGVWYAGELDAGSADTDTIDNGMIEDGTL